MVDSVESPSSLGFNALILSRHLCRLAARLSSYSALGSEA